VGCGAVNLSCGKPPERAQRQVVVILPSCNDIEIFPAISKRLAVKNTQRRRAIEVSSCIVEKDSIVIKITQFPVLSYYNSLDGQFLSVGGCGDGVAWFYNHVKSAIISKQCPVFPLRAFFMQLENACMRGIKKGSVDTPPLLDCLL